MCISCTAPKPEIIVTKLTVSQTRIRAMPRIDVSLRNEGSIILFTPLTEGARDWISENIPEDATWWSTSLVVDHRYAGQIIEGMEAAGLIVG